VIAGRSGSSSASAVKRRPYEINAMASRVQAAERQFGSRRR
jgi:hypothetical protein